MLDSPCASFSAEEAAVFISMNHIEECFERMNFQIRLVPVPLEIPAHPEDFPSIPGSHEGRFGNRGFHLLRLVLPVRPDLEDFDALAADAIANVQLTTNVLGWTTLFKEVGKSLPAPLKFDLREDHGAMLPVAPNE